MAEKTGKVGYVGSIPQGGAMNVKAPNQISRPSKNVVIRGKDLRSGKK